MKPSTETIGSIGAGPTSRVMHGRMEGRRGIEGAEAGCGGHEEDRALSDPL